MNEAFVIALQACLLGFGKGLIVGTAFYLALLLTEEQNG